MLPQIDDNSDFRPISSCFRLNNSKNFLAISRVDFGQLAGRGLSPRGHGDARGAGTALRNLIPSNGAVGVARRVLGV